jgi:hypothetical protein
MGKNRAACLGSGKPRHLLIAGYLRDFFFFFSAAHRFL